MQQHRSLVLVATLLGLLSLTACSKCSSKDGDGAAAQTELNMLIWPDYVYEPSIRQFEKENNVRIRITLYDSTEEMEGKLAYAGADSQYDVVIMASQIVARMVRRGLIRELDHSQIPNLKNLDPRFSGDAFDEGNKHAVPYQWGMVGLLYNKKKFPNLDPTWGVLFDQQKIVGTFEFLDEMRDMLGVALKYKGLSSNSTSPDEIREVGKMLSDIKDNPKCLGFKAGVGASQDVKGGSIDMAVVWNGDAYKVVQADKDQFALILPKEGSIMWIDTMTVLSKAPHPEMAHKFINYMLTPEAGAALSAMTKYATPNKAAMDKVPAEDRTNPIIYPSEEDVKRLEYHRDLGDATKNYDEVWTAIKSH